MAAWGGSIPFLAGRAWSQVRIEGRWRKQELAWAMPIGYEDDRKKERPDFGKSGQTLHPQGIAGDRRLRPGGLP
jgi:hypothetical protein